MAGEQSVKMNSDVLDSSSAFAITSSMTHSFRFLLFELEDLHQITGWPLKSTVLILAVL